MNVSGFITINVFNEREGKASQLLGTGVLPLEDLALMTNPKPSKVAADGKYKRRKDKVVPHTNSMGEPLTNKERMVVEAALYASPSHHTAWFQLVKPQGDIQDLAGYVLIEVMFLPAYILNPDKFHKTPTKELAVPKGQTRVDLAKSEAIASQKTLNKAYKTLKHEKRKEHAKIFGGTLGSGLKAALLKYEAKSKLDGVAVDITWSPPWNVPTVCSKCIEFIKLYGLKVEGLFQGPLNSRTVLALKKRFDDDLDEVQFTDPLLAASLLQLYLKELKESVIPTSHYKFFLANEAERKDSAGAIKDNFESDKILISSMPAENRDFLTYLVAFFRELLVCSPKNKMTSPELATVMAPLLFRSPDSPTVDPLSYSVVSRMINEYETLFKSSTIRPARGEKKGRMRRHSLQMF